jgi:hypothetical protein
VKKGKGSIGTPDKSRMGSCCFVVAITIEKPERYLIVTHLSKHLENGKRVYFTENNFQERLSSLKAALALFFNLSTKD